MTTHHITVCLGSNVPECQTEIRLALEWLASVFADMRHTLPYPTEPEGTNAGRTTYLNAVMEGTSILSKTDIESAFKAYEKKRGRVPAHKAEGRIIIDLDLVRYDNEVLRPDEFDTAYFQSGYHRLHDCKGI